MKVRPPLLQTLENCHAVRYLCVCATCGRLGDRRSMVSHPNGREHGECFCVRNKKDLTKAVLELPRTDADNLTLHAFTVVGEAGMNACRTLLARGRE